MTQLHYEAYPTAPLSDEQINDFAHLLSVGNAAEGDEKFNSQIDVLRVGGDDDKTDVDNPLFERGARAQVWQMFANEIFNSNNVAREAAITFGLAGESAENRKMDTAIRARCWSKC